MYIKKISHCCLIVEALGKRILTDPGVYSSEEMSSILDINVVLITHEHQDHFHIPSLKKVLEQNPNATVLVNPAVAELLSNENIPHVIVRNKEIHTCMGITFEGIGEVHAIMHKSLPQIQNTGFIIEDKLLFPGDAFTLPRRHIDFLALPVTGPWMKLSEAIDYCLEVKPLSAFPIHDHNCLPSQHSIPKMVLEKSGIGFNILPDGGELTL